MQDLVELQNYRCTGLPACDYLCTEESVIRISWMRVMSVLESHRLQDVSRTGIRADLSPGLSPASGFEHPASTLPTRFPAALGIGHGSACSLANACALVYVAA